LPGVDFEQWVPASGASGFESPLVRDEGRQALARSATAVEPPAPAVLPTRRGAPAAGWLARRGIQVDPGRRGAMAVGAAALVTALVTGWWLFQGRPHAAAVSPSPAIPSASSARPAPASGAPAPASGAPAPSSGAPAPVGSTAPAGSVVVVDVVGKVRRPGVYRLPAGARVDDALRAAGGALSGVDLSALNLARMLGDGEQIAVGVAGATDPGTVAPSASGGTSGAGPVNLNTATLEQLDGLPGVGPVLAQHILDWRAAHGRFDSVDQLREVSGIGPSKFADLKGLVSV
jgi:competence protein ComEA